MAYYRCGGGGKRKTTISYFVNHGQAGHYKPLGLYYENDIFEIVGYSGDYSAITTIKVLKKVKFVDTVGWHYGGDGAKVVINDETYYDNSTITPVELNPGDTFTLDCALGNSAYMAGNTLVFEL